MIIFHVSTNNAPVSVYRFLYAYLFIILQKTNSIDCISNQKFCIWVVRSRTCETINLDYRLFMTRDGVMSRRKCATPIDVCNGKSRVLRLYKQPTVDARNCESITCTISLNVLLRMRISITQKLKELGWALEIEKREKSDPRFLLSYSSVTKDDDLTEDSAYLRGLSCMSCSSTSSQNGPRSRTRWSSTWKKSRKIDYQRNGLPGDRSVSGCL